MNSTDQEWERWGRQDPYFGVITWDRFRADNLDDAARAEFFASGQWHVDSVLRSCRQYIDPDFAPKRVLDFGCGVGRVLVPFAAVAAEVVGVDVSPSMLAEARRNCDERGIGNVALELSDDQLSHVHGDFDLVHSVIVLQHIEPARGRLIFKRLVELVRPGGVGALHITFGKAYFPDSFGQPPVPPPPPPPPPPVPAPEPGLLRRLFGRVPAPPPTAAPAPAPIEEAPAPGGDPQMLMNPYNLSEIAFLLQAAGIAKFDAEFSDHGGELGVFLFFRRPGIAVRAEPAPTAESLIAVGNQLQSEYRWDEAVQHWTRALELMPGNATMLLCLAISHLRRTDLPLADAAFASLRAQHPNDAWGRIGVGLIAEARHAWDEADDIYMAVHADHPQHVSCIKSIVRVRAKVGRIGDARRFLTGLLEKNPESADIQEMLAGLSHVRKADIINDLIQAFKLGSYLEYNKYLCELVNNEVECAAKTIAYIPQHRFGAMQSQDWTAQAEVAACAYPVDQMLDVDELLERHAPGSFDIIFFDPMHVRPQVDRALQVLPRLLKPGGFLVVHDCSPERKEWTTAVQERPGSWCGETYKAFAVFHRHNPKQSLTVDEDYGVGVIVNRDLSLDYDIAEDMTFEEFSADRPRRCGLISYATFKAGIANGVREDLFPEA